MTDGYELGTADTLEEVMDKRTDVFDQFKVEQQKTQWKHKISTVPESAGITQKWWSYTAGVTRDGPEAKVPGGESIVTDQSGEYTVGVPALAGGALRIEGTAQSGSGDDFYTGYSNRYDVANNDGAGAGYKYFQAGEGYGDGASTAGAQEYVWFHSANTGVDNRVIPRENWNGDDLSQYNVDLSNLFHRGGFVRIDHTFYNEGAVNVNFGIKTDNGGLQIATLHSFSVENDPMWAQSDLPWMMGCEGTNLTGYINAAHYKAGATDQPIRFTGTGRDGTVMGSALGTITAGTPVPVISIKQKTDWSNVNLRLSNFNVTMDSSFYVFIATNTSLGTAANFQEPNSEITGFNIDPTEYAVLADNDAAELTDNGDIQTLKFVEASGNNQTVSTVAGSLPDFALKKGEIVTLGVIPIAATSFEGASLSWGGNF